MLINSLPHKTSSYSHHFDSTFCSCHKFIPDDIQIYVSLKKKKKKVQFVASTAPLVTIFRLN